MHKLFDDLAEILVAAEFEQLIDDAI